MVLFFGYKSSFVVPCCGQLYLLLSANISPAHSLHFQQLTICSSTMPCQCQTMLPRLLIEKLLTHLLCTFLVLFSTSTTCCKCSDRTEQQESVESASRPILIPSNPGCSCIVWGAAALKFLYQVRAYLLAATE